MISKLLEQRVMYTPYPIGFKNISGVYEVANMASLIFFSNTPHIYKTEDMVGMTSAQYHKINPKWTTEYMYMSHNLEQQANRTQEIQYHKNMGLLLNNDALMVFDFFKEPVIYGSKLIGCLTYAIEKDLNLFEVFDAYVKYYPKNDQGICVGREAFINFFKLRNYFKLEDFSDIKIRVLLIMLSSMFIHSMTRNINQHTFYRYSKILKESLKSGYKFQDLFHIMVKQYKDQKQDLYQYVMHL